MNEVTLMMSITMINATKWKRIYKDKITNTKLKFYYDSYAHAYAGHICDQIGQNGRIK